MPAVVFKNLSKVYKRGPKVGLSSRDWADLLLRRKFRPETSTFYALKDINLTIDKGEVVGIIGANGAGKSTLLKLVARVTYPTQGSIMTNGKVAGLLELGAGFHQELTGRENIFFQAAILGMTKKEIQDKEEEMIDFSGLEDFIDTPIKYYSSGMYARLGFSVAIHLNPDILLVDEILSVGDAAFQKKCIARIQEIFHDKNKAVIFISHNLGYVQELCQTVYLLDKGQIVMEGASDNVIAAYLKKVQQ